MSWAIQKLMKYALEWEKGDREREGGKVRGNYLGISGSFVMLNIKRYTE